MAHHANAFDASGFLPETTADRRALAGGDREAAIAALSDRLLDAVLLVGPPARCRERLLALREAGITWALLGPQRVGGQSLAEQAEILVRQLAPR
jgi:5,10-methylenetetrahydromethanopterin reductase